MSWVVVALWAASPWLLWGLAVLAMGLYRAHLAKALTPAAYVLAVPWVLLGLAVDVVVNMLVAPVVFLEPPWEWLVTDRLQRHLHSTGGWRKRRAEWICTNLLDPFDPRGRHC